MATRRYAGHVIGSRSSLRLTPEGARRARRALRIWQGNSWNDANGNRYYVASEVTRGSRKLGYGFSENKFSSRLRRPGSGHQGG